MGDEKKKESNPATAREVIAAHVAALEDLCPSCRGRTEPEVGSGCAKTWAPEWSREHAPAFPVVVLPVDVLCAFCGAAGTRDPEAMRAHVVACEKHPFHAMAKERDALRAEVAALKAERTAADGAAAKWEALREAAAKVSADWKKTSVMVPTQADFDRLDAALTALASAPAPSAPLAGVAVARRGEEVEVGTLEPRSLIEIGGKAWVISSHGATGTYVDPVGHATDTDWLGGATKVRPLTLTLAEGPSEAGDEAADAAPAPGSPGNGTGEGGAKPCPESGKCHGPQVWCNDCGDVARLCDDRENCDQHKRGGYRDQHEGRGEWHRRGGASVWLTTSDLLKEERAARESAEGRASKLAGDVDEAKAEVRRQMRLLDEGTAALDKARADLGNAEARAAEDRDGARRERDAVAAERDAEKARADKAEARLAALDGPKQQACGHPWRRVREVEEGVSYECMECTLAAERTAHEQTRAALKASRTDDIWGRYVAAHAAIDAIPGAPPKENPDGVSVARSVADRVNLLGDALAAATKRAEAAETGLAAAQQRVAALEGAARTLVTSNRYVVLSKWTDENDPDSPRVTVDCEEVAALKRLVNVPVKGDLGPAPAQPAKAAEIHPEHRTLLYDHAAAKDALATAGLPQAYWLRGDASMPGAVKELIAMLKPARQSGDEGVRAAAAEHVKSLALWFDREPIEKIAAKPGWYAHGYHMLAKTGLALRAAIAATPEKETTK